MNTQRILFLLSILLTSAMLTACGSEPDAAVAPAVDEADSVVETASEVVDTAVAEPEITILAFGDSLTAGLGVDEDKNYPSQLEDKLLADGYDVEVINGGISGETTSGGLSRVDWMLGTEPDIVIVETGGNDALRGVELDETAENMDEIVRRFSESGAVVIVAGMQIVQNLGEEYTTEFAAIYPAVSEKYGTILIPFFLEGVAADPDLNQDDFIHPTAEGYTVVVDHIYPFVLDSIAQTAE